MRLEEKNIRHGKLGDVSVTLKFLSYPGANVCYRHGKVVHGLDLGRLECSKLGCCALYCVLKGKRKK